MEMLLPGKSIESKFGCTSWGGEVFYADVSYSMQGNEIIVNVDGAGIDDIDSNALLQHLQSNGIIDNAESWKVKESRDTDGLTYIDETYTSFVIVKK